jgi:hypothetical protein
MQVITQKGTNVIVDIVDSTEVVENGLQVSKNGYVECVYANPDQYNVYDVVTIPTEVKAQSHKYDGTNFTVNAAYVPYVDPQQTIHDLKAQLAQTNADFANFMDFYFAANPGVS